MANPAVGYVVCRHCGEQARVTESKKGHLCITCPDGCAQEFTRNAASTAKVRAAMKPATQEAQADDHREEKPAASTGKPTEQPAAARAGRRRRFGISA